MTTATTNFGRDTSCTSSLRTGRFATGARLVAESAYRRLTTPRGMLRGSEEDENFGLDLVGICGSAATSSVTASLPSRIRAELSKDERILAVDVQVTTSTDGPLVTYGIEIEATTTEGPFTLQIEVSDVTVELLGIQAEG